MSEQPTKSVDNDGDIIWTLPNGYWHNENGPAVIYKSGVSYWYEKGKFIK